jgi:hypothetical protein
MNAHTASATALWRPITVKLHQWACAAQRLQHCTSIRLCRRPEDTVERGETVWSMAVAQGAMTVRFEWAEITRGVLALANPMGIVSNVRLATDEGDLLTPAQMLLEMNGTVHDLEWQGVVASELEAWRCAGAPHASVRSSKQTFSILGRSPLNSRSRAAAAFGLVAA